MYDVVGLHSFYLNRDSKYFVDVPTLNLQEIFKKNKLKKIDFLKMDCEGSEYEILYGLPKRYLKKIGKISFEYHNLDKSNKNFFKLKEFLEKNGFIVSNPIIDSCGWTGTSFAHRL